MHIEQNHIIDKSIFYNIPYLCNFHKTRVQLVIFQHYNLVASNVVSMNTCSCKLVRSPQMNFFIMSQP